MAYYVERLPTKIHSVLAIFVIDAPLYCVFIDRLPPSELSTSNGVIDTVPVPCRIKFIYVHKGNATELLAGMVTVIGSLLSQTIVVFASVSKSVVSSVIVRPVFVVICAKSSCIATTV